MYLYNVITFQIIVELASDSKEFPTQLARTKLAEMTGKAKIVPIAQTPSPPSDPPPLVQHLQQAPKPPVPPAAQQKVSEPERGFPRGRGGMFSLVDILIFRSFEVFFL